MTTKTITTLSLAALLVCPFSLWAGTAENYKQALSGVPAAELPARTVNLVNSTPSGERIAAAVKVVKAAVSQNPAAASAVVSAVAKSLPELAASAAAAAAAEQPKLAVPIGKAAAAVAPSKAGEIAVALCKVCPTQYRAVVAAVAEAAPKSGKAILKALAAAFPELKDGIDKAMASYAGNPPSVASVIDSIKTPVSVNQDLVSDPNTGARGPTVAPPYIPASSTGVNITPSTGGDVSGGGRNYAKP